MKWLKVMLNRLAPKRLPIPEPPPYPEDQVRMREEYHNRILSRMERELEELRIRSRLQM